MMPGDDPMMDPNFWWVLMLGRLKPGVNAAEARDALDVLLKRTVASAKPELTARDLPRVDLKPGALGQFEDRDAMREPLKTMAIVTAIVLLVACANVASLLLARGRSRVRELSIRVAIGAPRTRVVRQLLTEALMLALAGGAVGVVLATWMSGALAPALSNGGEPTEILTRLDARVLAFAIATAGTAAILFGLLPAFRATDLHVSAGLQSAGRGSVHGSRRRILPGALVVVQIALSLLLVAGAGLMIRTVWNLERVTLGFNAANLLLFRIDPSLNGYDGQRTIDLYSRVLERVRSAPGRHGGVALQSQVDKQLRHDRHRVTRRRGRAKAGERRADVLRENTHGLAPCRGRAVFRDARHQVRARPDVRGSGRGRRAGRRHQ